tara:strand:- start:184 stop:405 length:222 start_codon:yes stop_codon:yes gene_type:complete
MIRAESGRFDMCFYQLCFTGTEKIKRLSGADQCRSGTVQRKKKMPQDKRGLKNKAKISLSSKRLKFAAVLPLI